MSINAKEKHLNVIFVIASFNKKFVGWDYYYQIMYEDKQKKEFYLKELEQELKSIDVQKLMNWFLTPYEKTVIESKLNFEYIKELDFKTLENNDKKQAINPWLTGLYYTYTVNYIFIEKCQDFKKLCKRMVKSAMVSISGQTDTKQIKLIPWEGQIVFGSIEIILMIIRKYEDKIVLEIENSIKQYNKLKIEEPNMLNGFTNNPVGLDDIYEKLIFAANLLNNDKIKNSDKFQKYKSHEDFKPNNYFNFTLDMDDYDYNEFDLTYLKYISDKRLKKLKDILDEHKDKKSFLKHKLFDKIEIENDKNNFCKNRLLYLVYDEYLD